MRAEGLDRLEFAHEERSSRYLARLDGAVVSAIEYWRRDGTLIIVHTGTKPEFRGNGIAGRLTTFALDDVRARGLRIRPDCPYTARFVAEHPHYADLVD
ncbi:MAG TPA: GNAT family N-acetyltransferase [Microlunatus sp.]|nr:GNAT family N-acetyltransferase [Microlunatus sp.]